MLSYGGPGNDDGWPGDDDDGRSGDDDDDWPGENNSQSRRLPLNYNVKFPLINYTQGQDPPPHN